MSRYIDADALNDAMYHEAFETDSKMQKWDSGCWIRYKMFENAIANAPSIDIVRCKECKYASDSEYAHCTYVTWYNGKDDFCSRGERKESD